MASEPSLGLTWPGFRQIRTPSAVIAPYFDLIDNSIVAAHAAASAVKHA